MNQELPYDKRYSRYYSEYVDFDGIPIQDFRKLLAEDEKVQAKKKIDPNLERDLEPGWLLNYYIPLETMVWRRWAFWLSIMNEQKLHDAPIPRINFYHHGRTAEGVGSPCRKHIDECLRLIPERAGGFGGMSSQSHVAYFLDWLLYAFGDPLVPELPAEPPHCKGASMRLYQKFNCAYFVAYPYDYWAGVFVDICLGGRRGNPNAFYPTPFTVAQLMTEIMFAPRDIPEGIDPRLESVGEPCVGTGRLILPASNYSLVIHAADKDLMCVKACAVNFWFYVPWGVKPMKFIEDLSVIQATAKGDLTFHKDFANAMNSLGDMLESPAGQSVINPLYAETLQVYDYITALDNSMTNLGDFF